MILVFSFYVTWIVKCWNQVLCAEKSNCLSVTHMKVKWISRACLGKPTPAAQKPPLPFLTGCLETLYSFLNPCLRLRSCSKTGILTNSPLQAGSSASPGVFLSSSLSETCAVQKTHENFHHSEITLSTFEWIACKIIYVKKNIDMAINNYSHKCIFHNCLLFCLMVKHQLDDNWLKYNEINLKNSLLIKFKFELLTLVFETVCVPWKSFFPILHLVKQYLITVTLCDILSKY